MSAVFSETVTEQSAGRGKTESQIVEACERVFAEINRKPTQEQVRRALGGGSYSVIGPVLSAWWRNRSQGAEQKAQVEQTPIPEEVQKVFEAALRTAWNAAIAAQAEKLEAERAIMHGKVAEADEATRAAYENADALQARIDELESKLEDVQSHLEGVLAVADGRGKEIEQLHEAAAREAGRLTEIERERDAERLTNATLTSEIARLRTELDAQERATNQRIQDARDDADRRVKDAQKAAQERVEAAEKRAKGIEQERDRIASERDSARLEAQSVQAKLDASEREEKRLAAQIEQDRKTSEERIKELQAALAAIENLSRKPS